VLRLDPISV